MFANLMFTNISFFVCTEIKDCESTKYEAIQYQIGQINGKFRETIEGMLCEHFIVMNKRQHDTCAMLSFWCTSYGAHCDKGYRLYSYRTGINNGNDTH